MTLTIQSLRDVPYGKLDLNYPAPLVHGGHEWKSAAHFVLSAMFADPMYAKAVNASTCETINNVYAENKKKLFFETTSIAIRKAIEAKLQNSDFVRALLKTGDAAILYESKNSLMGVGPDGSGKNMYGEWLCWARSTVELPAARQPPDNRETAIYNAYVNTKLLIPLLRKHDLQTYVDRNFPRMSDLLKQLIHDVGSEAYRKLPDKETILVIHKNLSVDYCTNPTSLIKFVRRKYFREARDMNERELKFKIFDIFVESVSHLYSSEPVRRTECIRRDRETMDAQTVANLVSRTYDLFQSKSLPPAVQKKCEAIAAAIYLPPMSKIELHERETFKQYPASEQHDQQSRKSDAASRAVRIASDDDLGPSRAVEFVVDGRRFPTVGHYVNFRYMSMFGDCEKSYALLWDGKKRSWRSLLAVASDVDRQMTSSHDDKMCNLTNDILSVKFQNDSLHLMLLSTCGLQIETKQTPLFATCTTKFRDRTHPRVHVMTTIENVLAVEPFRALVATLSGIFETTQSNARFLAGGLNPSSARMVASLFGFKVSGFANQSGPVLHTDPVMNCYLHALAQKSLALRYDALLATYIFQSQRRRAAVTKFSKALSFVVDERDNAAAVALCRLCALLQVLAGGSIDQNTVDAASRCLRLEAAPTEDDTPFRMDVDEGDDDDDDMTVVSGGDSSLEEFDAEDEPDDRFFGSGKIMRFLENISDAVISEYIEDMLLEAVVGLRSSRTLETQTIVSFFCDLPSEVEL
jgi:predicted NAD-dependent protein-ADP-ribosyltransferase YbiA (DUF1768 family)